jgi:hypothetical protein
MESSHEVPYKRATGEACMSRIMEWIQSQDCMTPSVNQRCNPRERSVFSTYLWRKHNKIRYEISTETNCVWQQHPRSLPWMLSNSFEVFCNALWSQPCYHCISEHRIMYTFLMSCWNGVSWGYCGTLLSTSVPTCLFLDPILVGQKELKKTSQDGYTYARTLIAFGS